MSHCDEETLSLLALGEPAAIEVERHVQTCSRCAGEVQTLRRVVTAARDVVNEPPRIAPPPLVWRQIAAATGVEAAPRPSEVLRHAAITSPTAPAAYDASPAGDDVLAAEPVSLRRLDRWRRPDRGMLLLAAACLVIGLIGGGTGSWLISGRSSHSSTPQVVAQTSLAGLALAPSAVGQADVVQTSAGRQLDLDVQKLGIPDGFYEVWLIDPTVTKMVPIGVLSGSTGRFSLPDGVDLSHYPLVDISIQPLNGNPKHSGRSVLRGTLKS